MATLNPSENPHAQYFAAELQRIRTNFEDISAEINEFSDSHPGVNFTLEIKDPKYAGRGMPKWLTIFATRTQKPGERPMWAASKDEFERSPRPRRTDILDGGYLSGIPVGFSLDEIELITEHLTEVATKYSLNLRFLSQDDLKEFMRDQKRQLNNMWYQMGAKAPAK